MGGTNQSTANPPATPTRSVSGKPISGGSVRFHESKPDGEAHFHDDIGGKKCAVDYATFMKRYAEWRKSAEDELIMLGHDGSGGRSQIHFQLFPDDCGKLDVAMTVGSFCAGQTLTDLDTLADFK